MLRHRLKQHSVPNPSAQTALPGSPSVQGAWDIAPATPDCLTVPLAQSTPERNSVFNTVLISSLDIGASELRPQVFTDQEAALMIVAKADANALLAALMSTQACVAAQTPVKSVKALSTTWRLSTELFMARYLDSFFVEIAAYWDDNLYVYSDASSSSWETVSTIEDVCHTEQLDTNYWVQRHRQEQHRQRLQEHKKQQWQRWLQPPGRWTPRLPSPTPSDFYPDQCTHSMCHTGVQEQGYL